MNKKRIVVVFGLLLLALFLVACGGEGQTVEVTRLVEVTRVVEVSGEAAAPEMVTFAGAGDTLQAIQSRGVLKCGGNANVPGFGYLEPDSGDFSGFDIDFCHAMAAAALGDAEAIEVRRDSAPCATANAASARPSDSRIASCRAEVAAASRSRAAAF